MDIGWRPFESQSDPYAVTNPHAVIHRLQDGCHCSGLMSNGLLPMVGMGAIFLFVVVLQQKLIFL